MSHSPPTFDPIWEETIYSQGRQLNRYPFDMVVSFVYRYRPLHKTPHETKILEIGCGAGNNLWFAAREGFQVSGVDASSSAIAYARERFAEEGLMGDLQVSDYTRLPFKNEIFDLVIDRGAITCCGISAARKAVDEVRKVLQTGGRFLCNPYSDRHSSFVSGCPGPDGLTLEISAGTLVGTGQICFRGRREVEALFGPHWKILSVQHVELVEELQPQYLVHAEWRVIAEKITSV
jgi:SAM-dependent methyltransferase